MRVLDTTQYKRLSPLLGPELLPANLPSLSAVVEGNANAIVYVDRCDRPTRALAALHGGWVFPLGPEDPDFARETMPALLAQCESAYPLFAIWPTSQVWDTLLAECYALWMTRVHFAFVQETGDSHPERPPVPVIPIDFAAMAPMTASIDPWLPDRWRNMATSSSSNFGYCVTVDGEIASAAWAGLVGMRVAQFDVVTNPAHQRKGYGEAVCRAMLAHCRQENLVPHWSTDLANTPSYHLALKLGFTPTSKSTAYVWCRELTKPSPKWGSDIAEIDVNPPGTSPAVKVKLIAA